jgi:hypothetical protein
MKTENCESKGRPKRRGKLSGRKSRMLKVAQEWKPITSPKLREVYSKRIEWATNLLPKLKIEVEAPEEKEERALSTRGTHKAGG